jgi:hypothetical protein
MLRYHLFLKDKQEKEEGKTYVYCLFVGEYDDRGLMSVHSTLEKAEAEALTWPKYMQDTIDIVEQEVR